MVVRSDLSPSQRAVQACHACLEAGKHFPWQGDHPHLALLVVPDEVTLRHWLARVQEQGLQTAPFYEPDLQNSLTAFAVPGVSTPEQRLVFAGLPTLKLTTTKEKKMTTFQSRWGFHPCSREFFLKLKRLNILAQKALRQMAICDRWHRKEPQNRRRFVGMKGSDRRDWKKREVSKCNRLYEPVPEPLYPPIDKETIDLIAADYRNARYPVALQTEVKTLTLSEQKVNSLLSLLEMHATRKVPAAEVVADAAVK